MSLHTFRPAAENILTCAAAQGLTPEEALTACAARQGAWLVPPGIYRLQKPLALVSGVNLDFAQGAVICAADSFQGQALVTAADPAGSCRIRLRGGVWDGEGKLPALMDFRHVQGLRIENAVLSGYGESAFVGAYLTRFLLRNITLAVKKGIPSGDGIALWGGCDTGIIRTLRHEGESPKGALVGMYADGKPVSAPLRQIALRDVASLSCRHFLRMVSVDTGISDISVQDIAGGCSHAALALDGTRLAGEDSLIPRNHIRYYTGTGDISGLSVSGMELFSTGAKHTALVDVQTNLTGFTLKDLRRPGLLDKAPACPTVRILNVSPCDVLFSGLYLRQLRELLKASRLSVRCFSQNGFETRMGPGETLVLPRGGFSKLTIHKTE